MPFGEAKFLRFGQYLHIEYKICIIVHFVKYFQTTLNFYIIFSFFLITGLGAIPFCFIYTCTLTCMYTYVFIYVCASVYDGYACAFVRVFVYVKLFAVQRFDILPPMPTRFLHSNPAGNTATVRIEDEG